MLVLGVHSAESGYPDATIRLSALSLRLMLTAEHELSDSIRKSGGQLRLPETVTLAGFEHLVSIA